MAEGWGWGLEVRLGNVALAPRHAKVCVASRIRGSPEGERATNERRARADAGEGLRVARCVNAI